jgi:hypothetical protein
MSEQPPQDQTHGYNEKATEAIAAMQKNEQGLPIPAETSYNQSQLILNSDPEAMARSKEMERWSEKSGRYSEAAASSQKKLTDNLIEQGASAEEVRQATTARSEHFAQNGVILSDNPASSGDTVKPLVNGVLTNTSKTSRLGFDRSPTNVGLDQGIVSAAKKIIN